MRRANILIAASLALMTPGLAQAQVAGSTVLGVAAAELREVATGWSAKRQVLGRPVFNDKNEKVGTVDDIIISPDKAVSYAIVGAGGFLGVAKHDVAIPVSQFSQSGGKLVLAGATKEAIKALPPFEYGRR
jgi:sporulation protein YlmC with PRC-barrel domain